jgi:hypothetical protein
MSEEAFQADSVADSAGSNVEISSEPISTEIGSGDVADEVAEESGLRQEIDGEQMDALADAVEEAVEDGATEEEIQELIETFNIKVNGREKEVTLDWNDKDDIIRRLQMAEAGHSAMERSKQVERSFDNVIQSAIDDPWSFLEEIGLDPDQLAEARIEQQIQHLQKTPEQLAQEERDAELEELRQRLKDQEEEKSRIEEARLQQEAEIDLDNQITDALSATTELPKSPYVVKRIADAMLTALENGHEDITPKDIIPWVEKEINEEIQELFSAMPDKVLERYLGNKTIDRLRKQRLAKMQNPTNKVQQTGKKPVEKTASKKKIKLGDWLKHGSSLRDL